MATPLITDPIRAHRESVLRVLHGVGAVNEDGGKITVEATSPGLTPASVTITAKGVTLRPQVALWNREVPAGSGITGLWRPIRQPPATRHPCAP